MIAALLLVALAVPVAALLTAAVRPSDPNARAVVRAIRREAQVRQQRRAVEARR